MEKVVFFEMEAWEEGYITESLNNGSKMLVNFCKEMLTTNTVKDFIDATVISPFIYSTLTREVLSQLPQLKLIVTRSTGFDTIDLDYCKEKNITVCNVPAYGVHTVAEHTFALILALSRNIVASVDRTRRGNFNVEGLMGFDLNGKVFGVIGTGTIGKRVAEIALCFGMQVQGFAHHPDPDLQKAGVKYVELDELFKSSDVVSLHVPGSPDNTHMINMDNIKNFKKGSILINTARGSLVDTQAIVYGLENKILKGVGLDVLEEEVGLKEEHELLSSQFLKNHDLQTQLMNHVLLDRDNVLITPHNAFHSEEALKQITDTTINNIKTFLAGKPENVVNQQ